MTHTNQSYNFSLRRIRYGALMSASALLLLLHSGCINDSVEPCPPSSPAVPEGMMLLKLRINTENPLPAYNHTRAWPDDEETGSADENRIDTENRDFLITLFDAKGNYIGTFSQNSSPDYAGTPSDIPIPVLPDNYTYEVTTLLSKELIENNPEVQIMVMANLNNLRSENTPYNNYISARNNADGGVEWTETNPQSTSTLNFSLSRFEQPGRAVSYTYNSLNGDSRVIKSLPNTWIEAWQNIDNCSSVIPMYGCKSFKLDISNAVDGMALDLGDMYLLRAMSKIEVTDALNRDAGDEYPKVTAVMMRGHNRDGVLIPDPYTQGQQVENMTIPSSYAGAPLTDAFTPFAAIPSAQTDAQTFKAFFPETPFNGFAASSTSGNILYQDILEMVAMIQRRADEEPKPYIFRIKEADNWNVVKGFYRNHLYRLNITGFPDETQESDITLKWEICPWVTMPDVVIPPFERPAQ